MILEKIKKFFNKDRKIVFFTTFIIGLIVHLGLYSNQLLAYDAYWHYGSFLAKGWEVSLGRFFIPFIDMLRGTVVSSSLTSVIAIALVSLTTLILTDILKIKKNYIKILIGILLVVNPTFSLTLMYAYTGDSYTLALLFSVLSVYFLTQKLNRKNVVLSVVCIILSLGFYQAYLCVTLTLLAIVYLINLCTEKELKFKDIIKKIALDVVIILASIVLYYILFTIIVKILNLNITEYNGGNKVLSLETLRNLLPSIKNAYITFYNFYFTNNIIASTKFTFRHVFNIFMLLLVIVNFVILIINNKTYKSPLKFALMVVLLVTLPICTCIIEIIVQGRQIDLLMAAALYLPIVLLLKQIELIKFNKLNTVSILVIFISLWTFTLTDNATYVATLLYNRQMAAEGNRIIERIENNEEITDETPICIMGNMKFDVHNPRLLKLTNFDVSIVNTWTWQVFLQDNLALGRNICTNDTYEDIENNEEYLNMGIFPSKDSFKIIDGTLVIKIGY